MFRDFRNNDLAADDSQINSKGVAMVTAPFLRYVIAGKLQRDFILPITGNPALDVPGGSLIHAASGLRFWEDNIGLIGRVGENYPQEWLNHFSDLGFDRRGIHIIPQEIDMRFFAAYPDHESRAYKNPVAHFSRLGLAFPKNLLGYSEPGNQLDSRTQPGELTIRLNDFPMDYLDATAAHIAPLDYLSHSLLPSLLRQGHITTLTLDPSTGYMNPTYWDDIPAILRGISVFHCSEEKLTNLFQGRSSDLWEMAEALSGYGCELIVIKRGARGQCLYDHARRTRWRIPAYPARVVDPTGAGDVFCGGFLAAFRQTYDPLEAVLRGNITASMAIEGCGPFYGLKALPQLAMMRLESLRDRVVKE